MAHAYTPGLKVTENELLRRRRILPIKGEVVVEEGVGVGPKDVVARTFLPGRVEIVNVANKMGVDQSDVPGAMVKKEGDEVLQGEVIAESKSLFGLLKSRVTASLEGKIESVSGVTGQVVLRGPPQPVEIDAYLEGRVMEVIPNEGVVVESCGALIQGIFGIGGEAAGEIAMASPSPRDILDEDSISAEHHGKVIVGGALVTGRALKKAIQLGVSGVVVGGFDDQDLREFLGHDLGVAITGHEKLGLTLIVTEGFGRIDMAPRTFSLLRRRRGQRASINGGHPNSSRSDSPGTDHPHPRGRPADLRSGRGERHGCGKRRPHHPQSLFRKIGPHRSAAPRAGQTGFRFQSPSGLGSTGGF